MLAKNMFLLAAVMVFRLYYINMYVFTSIKDELARREREFDTKSGQQAAEGQVWFHGFVGI